MGMLPSGSIPITVTSPPYDRIRTYGGDGSLLPFEKFTLVAEALWRVTMPGGVVLWHIGDGREDGTLSGTGFRQALHFQEIGFRFDSFLIIATHGWRQPGNRRYPDQATFVWVLSKGRPRVFNPIQDRPNRTVGQRVRRTRRGNDGTLCQESTEKRLGPFGIRGNIWYVHTGGFAKSASEPYAYGHPALMPESLARDLIRSWSLPGDLVFDPFGGACTTAKMALLNDRRYLTMEAHEPYYRLGIRRMLDAHAENRRRLDRVLGLGLPPGGA
jgi:site-specific DNA-methyltransferase (adenine-specific)